jgi:DNA-binding MurR/RpiR family transcriptional regulator
MSILERIKSHSAKLTDADRRLVTTLLENRAEAAYLNGIQLAERAQVHEATATRLAQKLGYKGQARRRS